MTSIARIVSLTVLATIMVFLGISFFHVVAPFLMPLFLAAVAAILCQPLFRYFMMWTSDRTRISAGLTTLTVLFLILFPIVIGITTATVEIYTYVHVTMKDDQWKEDAGDFIRRLPFHKLDDLIHPFLGDIHDKNVKANQEQFIEDEKTKKDVNQKSDEKENNKKDSTPIEKAEKEKSEKKETVPKKTENQENSDQSITKETSENKNELADSEAGEKTDPEESEELSEEEKKEKEVRDQIQVTEIVDTMGKDIAAALLAIAQRSAGFAGAAISGIIGAFIASIIGLVMFIVALYYFLSDGPSMLAATEKMIPVHVPYQKEMIHRFEITVRSVVFATMLSAIAQGIATSFMLSMVVKTPFFILFLVATVASLIPMAGAWLVWGPYALGLIFQTEPQWGSVMILVIVGGVLIGTMDNVIKTYVLQNDIRLHPLLALVSVLGGIQTMGLWGVFIGPIVASCLYALVRIFNTELKELSQLQKEGKLKEKEAGSTTNPLETSEKEIPDNQSKTQKEKPASKETKKQNKKGKK